MFQVSQTLFARMILLVYLVVVKYGFDIFFKVVFG